MFRKIRKNILHIKGVLLMVKRAFLCVIASAMAGCLSVENVKKTKGTLCLTFDDRSFENWVNAIPLFAEYDAHVTFFVYGEFDGQAVDAVKKLQNAGHTIGLHALNHAKAVEYIASKGAESFIQNEIMPQLRSCRQNGIMIRAFAYPFSQRNAETDAVLFRHFDFLRTNCTAVMPSGTELADADGFFNHKIERKHLFYGFPASGKFDIEAVKKAMDRAAEENAVIVFYAHNIMEYIPQSHHIALSQLEDLLKYASSLGMAVKGMNEL